MPTDFAQKGDENCRLRALQELQAPASQTTGGAPPSLISPADHRRACRHSPSPYSENEILAQMQLEAPLGRPPERASGALVVALPPAAQIDGWPRRPMKPIHLWERISRSGLHAGLDAELERKVILCNQIGASAGFALFAGAASLAARGHMVLAPFMVAFSLLYFLAPFWNGRGLHTFSRVYLCALPPLLVTLLAGLVLYRDSTFKFAMIPTILVPILVFGITERARMLAGIACMVVAFLMMDAITPWIPRLQGVTISDEEITQNAIINGLITFFTFSASFIYLQRLNQKAEQALS